MLDHAGLPHDLFTELAAAEKLEIVDVPRDVVRPEASESELAMHRRAASLARTVLEAEIAKGASGLTDRVFTGRLERELRRAGAEDLFVLVSNGRAAPAPASGRLFDASSSASVALEYGGHWARVSRNVAGVTCSLPPGRGATLRLESLSEGSGWEGIADSVPGRVISVQVEINSGGNRLFYGDTCVQRSGTVEVL
jgi:hypothetical protein